MPGQELRRQRRAFWKGSLRSGLIGLAVAATIAALAVNAEISARQARAAEAEAKRQKDLAQTNADRATREALEANDQRTVAVGQKREADRQRDVATNARNAEAKTAASLRVALQTQETLSDKAARSARTANEQRNLALARGELAQQNALTAGRNAAEARHQTALVLAGRRALEGQVYENTLESLTPLWERGSRAEVADLVAATDKHPGHGWEWSYWHRVSRAEYVAPWRAPKGYLGRPSLFVPEGGARFIAYDSRFENVALFDAATGRKERDLWKNRPDEPWSGAAAFSRDGRWAVRLESLFRPESPTSPVPSRYTLYDLRRGVRTTLPLMSGVPRAVSDDGSRVATVSAPSSGSRAEAAGRVMLWDLATDKPLVDRTLGPEFGNVQAFSPDLRAALVAYRDPKTRQAGAAEVDLQTGTTLNLYLLPPSRIETDSRALAKYAGNAVIVAIVTRVGVFDHGATKPRRTLALTAECRSLSASADGRLLLTDESAPRFAYGGITSGREKGQVWDLRTGARLAEAPQGTAFAAGGRLVLHAATGGIEAVDWRATASYTDTGSLNLQSGSEPAHRFQTPSLGSDGNPMTTVSSEDGSHVLAYAFYDENERPLGRYPAHGDLPKDDYVLFAGPLLLAWHDGRFAIHRIADPRVVRTLGDPHPGAIYAYDMTPDGALVALADVSGTLRLYGKDPEPIVIDTGMIDVHTDAGGKKTPKQPDVALFRGGSRVAVVSARQGLRVWDVATRRLLASSPKTIESEQYIGWTPLGARS